MHLDHFWFDNSRQMSVKFHKFKNMAAYIITRKYKEATENITEKTAGIICTTANIIKAKRNISYNWSHIKKWLNSTKPSVSTSNHMFGKEIWDKLPECIFENFEITRVIYPKNRPNQPSGYWLITPNQQALCIETNIF